MSTRQLPLIAALMIGTASISAPFALAQDKEKGPPAASQRESAPPSAERESQAKPDKPDRPQQSPDRAAKSEDSGNKPQKSQASEGRGSPDRKAAQSDNDDKKVRSNRADDKSDQKDRDQSSSKKADKSDQEPQSDKKADTKPTEPSNKQADDRKSDQPDSKSTAGTQEPGKGSQKQATSGDREKPEKVRSADVSGDKKSRVQQSFKSENIKHVTNVNINISVGRRLPRDWDYRPVPAAVIAIVPEYRGYHYAYVEDEYVIIDPDTYEVVYVLDSDGGGSASVGRSSGESGRSQCAADLTFSQEDRTFIYEKVYSKSAAIEIGNVKIGVELPKETRVETFPAEVTTRVKSLDSCRYVVVEDEVAVIDPDQDRIVAVIER